LRYLLCVEPLKRAISTSGLFVRVGALPVLEIEARFREIIQGIFNLRLFRYQGLFLLLIGLLGLGLLLCLGSRGRSGFYILLLLWWRGELDSLLRVCNLSENWLQLWLINDGLKMTNEVREFGA